MADRGVLVSAGILIHRQRTQSGIVVAGVEVERVSSYSGIVAASYVFLQRMRTDGGIAATSDIAV